MRRIWDYLRTCEHGNTVDNMMEDLGLARGTIKPHLYYLMLSDNVVEYVYSQNTKIYKVKHEEYKEGGFFNSIVVDKNL